MMELLKAGVCIAIVIILADITESRPQITSEANTTKTERFIEGIHVEESTEYGVKRSSLADSIIQVTDQLIEKEHGVINKTIPNTMTSSHNRKEEGIVNDEIVISDDDGHQGVVVPLTMKDIEREMAAVDMLLKSSTSKEGISTWILLSESSSTASPDINGLTYDIETKGKASEILTHPHSGNVETPKVINGKVSVKNNTQRKKHHQKESNSDEKILKGKKQATTTPSPEKTTKFIVTDGPVTRQTPTVDSTTFLILEPKDADFDLPQDRSPSLHKKVKVPTKTPNKSQQKNKNKNQNIKKKPSNHDNSKPGNNKPIQKEKPISTKIYNYLSREVMPTVGVSLVGLVVTAGIASYLLGGPFGAIRRSYDVDRKDDVYFNNNEEYAGPDGQFEEEWLSKVMAGSPSYRNSIRYHGYRPVQAPNQVYHTYSAYKYPQYNRYRTAANPLIMQYNPHQSHHQPSSNYHMYKTYNPLSQVDVRNTQKSISGTVSYVPNEVSSKINQSPAKVGETISEIKASQSITVGSLDNVPSSENSNQQLQHRSQFVVGSIINDQVDDTIPVPEHGPRRRKRRNTPNESISRGISDNEIDVELNDIDNISIKTIKKADTNVTNYISETTVTDDKSSATEYINTITSTEDNSFIDLVRRIVDLKIRFSLGFLQNATATFQKYLHGVQERVANTYNSKF